MTDSAQHEAQHRTVTPVARGSGAGVPNPAKQAPPPGEARKLEPEPRGPGVKQADVDSRGGKGEIVMTAKPENAPKRIEITTDDKTDMLGHLRWRAHAAQRAIAEGHPISRLDAYLVKELGKGEGEDSLFARLQKGGGLEEGDLATVWLAISETELEMQMGLGTYGATVETTHGQITGIQERKNGRTAQKAVAGLLDRVEGYFFKSNGFLWRLGISGGGLGRHREALARGRVPRSYDKQNGNEFQNAIARRIDAWQRTHQDQDWKKFVREHPGGALDVLHEAIQDTLPIFNSDIAEEFLKPDSHATSTVAQIDRQIQRVKDEGAEPKEPVDFSKEEEEIGELRKDKQELEKDRDKKEARRTELRTRIKARTEMEAELGGLPDRIRDANENAEKLGKDARDARDSAKQLTGKEATAAVEAANDLTKQAGEARTNVQKLRDREVDLRNQLKGLNEVEDPTALRAELKTLNRELDGDERTEDENNQPLSAEKKRGILGRIEDLEDTIRRQDRALQKKKDDDAKARGVQAGATPATPDPEQQEKEQGKRTARLELWKSANTAEGMNGILYALNTDPLAQAREYSGKELGSTMPVGETFGGTDRIRQLIFREAIRGEGKGTYNPERAREALDDEAIVRGMLRVDRHVGDRSLVGDDGQPLSGPLEIGDKKVTTIRELLQAIDTLRNEGGHESEIAEYQKTVTRSALPALAEPTWLPGKTMELAGILVKAGGDNAAHTENLEQASRLRFTGNLEAATTVTPHRAAHLAATGRAPQQPVAQHTPGWLRAFGTLGSTAPFNAAPNSEAAGARAAVTYRDEDTQLLIGYLQITDEQIRQQARIMAQNQDRQKWDALSEDEKNAAADELISEAREAVIEMRLRAQAQAELEKDNKDFSTLNDGKRKRRIRARVRKLRSDQLRLARQGKVQPTPQPEANPSQQNRPDTLPPTPPSGTGKPRQQPAFVRNFRAAIEGIGARRAAEDEEQVKRLGEALGLSDDLVLHQAMDNKGVDVAGWEALDKSVKNVALTAAREALVEEGLRARAEKQALHDYHDWDTWEAPRKKREIRRQIRRLRRQYLGKPRQQGGKGQVVPPPTAP